MLRKILIKDMKKRKEVNFILFLFIVIATIFLASSLNNIFTVSSGLNYYFDYAKVADITYPGAKGAEEQAVKDWLESNKDIKDYSIDHSIALQEKMVTIARKSKKNHKYDANGQSMSIGSSDVKYSKPFDENGKKLVLKDGEMALAKTEMDRNNLSIGDQLQIKFGDEEKTYKIAKVTKDAIYGSQMSGMTRFIVNQNEMDSLEKNEAAHVSLIYNVMTDHVQRVEKDFNKQAFVSIGTSLYRSSFEMMYSFDMIQAGLLIAIGISLILIALLVLRFTITFTLEEDYRQIGIMKAIGFRDFNIKEIYLIKYFVIVLFGTILGFFISFPVGNAMIKSVSSKMIMASSKTHMMANVFSTLAIIAITMLFCYASTRSLNKLSAVQTIRGGQSGKRYRKRRGLTLHKHRKMRVPLFLAENDVLVTVKRYLILMITFCIGFVLIAFPVNTANTLQSSEMAGKFSIDPNQSAYVSEFNFSDTSTLAKKNYAIKADYENIIDELSKKMKNKGYDASITGIILYSYYFYGDDINDKTNFTCTLCLGANPNFLSYKEGTAPKLDNEVGVSSAILKEKGWKIGDTIHAKINGEIKNLVITGTYDDYVQLGESIRLSPSIDPGNDPLSGFWKLMVDLDNNKTQQQNVDTFTKEFPEYQWSTAQDVLDSNVGGIQDSLRPLKYGMTTLICMILMLITTLMVKLFVVREKGEIAMMKSIGFKTRTIRQWQILRMCIVLFVSLILSVPLNMLANQFVLKPLFSIMGAAVKIKVVGWQVYGLYPLILLVGIILATVYATKGIKKIDIREQNNLE